MIVVFLYAYLFDVVDFFLGAAENSIGIEFNHYRMLQMQGLMYRKFSFNGNVP